MLAPVPFGGAPSKPTADESDPPSEPFLLESLLADIRVLRARSRALAQESQEEARRHPATAWEKLRDEVALAHERAERTLTAAAGRDGVPLAAIQPPADILPASEGRRSEDAICRFRRMARELEQQCASVLGQAGDLGLTHLGRALGRWRRELIGLEQPLIAVNAQASASRRS
jgi:hypothetical protein